MKKQISTKWCIARITASSLGDTIFLFSRDEATLYERESVRPWLDGWSVRPPVMLLLFGLLATYAVYGLVSLRAFAEIEAFPVTRPWTKKKDQTSFSLFQIK